MGVGGGESGCSYPGSGKGVEEPRGHVVGAGEYEEALGIANEAVKLGRDLARKDLAIHRRDLQRSLLVLCGILTGLGRTEEAETIQAELESLDEEQ